jgi:hypothetical protein
LELSLEKCVKVTEIGIKNIALSPNVKRLENLTIKDWRVSEQAIKFISTSDNLVSLSKLELINIQINIAGVDNILTSTQNFKKLKYISIEKNNTLNDECADFIYNSRGRFVQQLQTLKLDTYNKIKFTGWLKLRKIACVEIDLTSFEYNNDIYDINDVETPNDNKEKIYNMQL